jgi:hypothetical protein
MALLELLTCTRIHPKLIGSMATMKIMPSVELSSVELID